MAREEAVAEFEKATTEEPAVDTQAPAESPEQIEAIEYLLGDQKGKLPVNAEFNINHDGKIVRAPLSKVINSFRLRSKLDDDMRAYKEGLSKFEKERGEYSQWMEQKKSLEPYMQLQKWSESLEQSNPNGYRMLMDTVEKIKNGFIGGEANTSGIDMNAANAVISDLRRELEGIKSWKGEFDKKQEQEALQKDIELVKSDIAKFSEFAKKKGIDLSVSDESGLTVEDQIIKFGAENGYPTFESAALVYLKDKLLETAQAQGRTEAVKNLKAERASGIVAKSSKPFSGKGTEASSGLSRDDRRAEALQELLSSMNTQV